MSINNIFFIEELDKISQNYQQIRHLNRSSAICIPINIKSKSILYTQGNPISGYRRLRDFGGKQMTSSSDRVCIYPFFIAYILFI